MVNATSRYTLLVGRPEGKRLFMNIGVGVRVILK
jgi:hypothetical protein